MKDLSEIVASKIVKMDVGQKEMFYMAGNLYMVLLCDRKMPPRKVLDNKRVEMSVFNKKLHTEIINYIHNLNRKAIIEIRE